MAEKMKKVLEELKLDHLIPNFKREKIDIDIFLSLTEDQLNKLGIKKVDLTKRFNLSLMRLASRRPVRQKKDLLKTPHAGLKQP